MQNDYSALKVRVAFLHGSASFTSALNSDGEQVCMVHAGITKVAPQFKLNSFVWPGGAGFAINFENTVAIHEVYYALDERTGEPTEKWFPPIHPTDNFERGLKIQGIDNDGDGVVFKFDGSNLFLPLTMDIIEKLKTGSVDGRTFLGRPFHPINHLRLSL